MVGGRALGVAEPRARSRRGGPSRGGAGGVSTERCGRRSPAFALTAVLILALGIGANTALWSAVRTLLVDPLPRQLAFAYSLFGGLAMLLAAIGLFGLAAYGVAQRTQEIGIRMALGARGADVAAMVLRDSLRLVAVGVLFGVAGAVAAGRLIEGLLFELAPSDPVTVAVAVVTMVLVGACAAYLPARRRLRLTRVSGLRSGRGSRRPGTCWCGC